MSDFLFIIPSGWTEFPVGTIDLIPAGIGSVQSWIDSGSVSLLDEAMRDAGILTDPEKRIVEARLFNGESLVVRFG